MTLVAMLFAYAMALKHFAVDNDGLNRWSMLNYENQELALNLLSECQPFDLVYSILLVVVGEVLVQHQQHDDVEESVVRFVALQMGL